MTKSLLSRRVAIFGAGAVGCYFGRFFVEAGYNTVFIARGGQLEALKSLGMLVTGPDAVPYRLDVKASDRLEGVYDLILVCVKSQNTLEAAAAINGHISEGGFVVSLQNGVENPSLLMSVLGADKVVPTAIYLTASINGCGRLFYQSRGKVLYGWYNESGRFAAEEFGKILAFTSICNKFSNDIKANQWKKLCFNVAMNPISALIGMDFAHILENKDALSLSQCLFDEAKGAAAIEGVSIEDEEFDSVLTQCSLNPKFKTSMLQDVEANKHPEVDAILGAVVRAYESVGKTAPYSDMLLKIIRIKFGNWFQISPRLAADVLVALGDKVLLIERKNEPKGWAVPGGFVNLYETMEQGAARELFEETGISAPVRELELLNIYSDPKRDPRGHTVSAVYVYRGGGDPKAGDDAKSARYFNIRELPDVIAFDHNRVIDDYCAKYNIE